MIKRASLALTVAVTAITGCQRTADIQEDPTFSMSPLVIDQAMQHRNWGASVVEYPNGAVVAGPTLFPYETTRTDPNWQQSLFAPVLFVGQTIILPFHAVVTPPWTEVAYQGVDFEPTHTAVPPLPPTDPQVLAALRDRTDTATVSPVPQKSATPAKPAAKPAPESRDDAADQVDQTVEQLTQPAPSKTITPAPKPDQPAAQVVQPATQPRSQPPTTRPAPRPELNK